MLELRINKLGQPGQPVVWGHLFDANAPHYTRIIQNSKGVCVPFWACGVQCSRETPHALGLMTKLLMALLVFVYIGQV